jgi:hypothetical protein
MRSPRSSCRRSVVVKSGSVSPMARPRAAIKDGVSESPGVLWACSWASVEPRGSGRQAVAHVGIHRSEDGMARVKGVPAPQILGQGRELVPHTEGGASIGHERHTPRVNQGGHENTNGGRFGFVFRFGRPGVFVLVPRNDGSRIDPGKRLSSGSVQGVCARSMASRTRPCESRRIPSERVVVPSSARARPPVAGPRETPAPHRFPPPPSTAATTRRQAEIEGSPQRHPALPSLP